MDINELDAFFAVRGNEDVLKPGAASALLARGPSSSVFDMASEFTYGELTVEGVSQLLVDAGARFEEVNGRPPKVFLDLGSGGGKVVLCVAGMLPNLERAVGVELSAPRHEIARRDLNDLCLQEPDLDIQDRVYFLQQDVRKAVAPIAAADVIWVSNTCFPAELNKELGGLLDQYAQKGTIVYATRDLSVTRRAGGSEAGSAEGDVCKLAVSWRQDHRAGVSVLLGQPLALAATSTASGGPGQVPEERAFVKWARALDGVDETPSNDADDSYLLAADMLPAALTDALLSCQTRKGPAICAGSVLEELYAEDGLLAEICAEASESHPDGLDFEAWQTVFRESREAVLGHTTGRERSAFGCSWLCGL